MALEQFTGDPKFMALSPEAKAIVLSKKEGLSPDAAKIVVSKLGSGPGIMDKLDKFTRETPGLREGARLAEFLGFGDMARSVQNLPQTVSKLPETVSSLAEQAKNPRNWIPKKQDVINALPLAAGLFAGPLAGRATGAALKLAPRIAATSLGTGVGEAARTAIEGEPVDAGSVAKAMTAGAIGEAGGEILSGLKVGGKAMTEEGRGIAAMAKEKGLPLSASSIAPTKTAKAFEWIGESLPTGKGWATWKRQKLQEGLTRMMDDVVAELPKHEEAFDAGASLKAGITKAKTTLKGTEKAAYKDFAETLGTDAFSVRKTARILEKIRDSYTGDARAWIEAYAKKGSEWIPADVDAFQGQIWKKLGRNDPNAGKLLNAFKDDLGNLSSMLLEKAKEQGHLLRSLSSNDTVRAVLKKYAQDPEQAIRAAFRSGNLDDVNVLKKSLDAETWDIARSRFVENLFDASTEITGTQRAFNPQKFADLFDKYKRQIRQVMPEKYDYIEQFSKLSRASVSDLNKINMNQITKGWQTAATGGLGFGAATGNGLVLFPAGASFGITKSIMNPNGWLKKWLTEGMSFNPKNALRAGETTKALAIGGKSAIKEKEAEE